MANIFDTLLKSKRPQALETISNVEKEREALVEKLQEVLHNSLTELIESIYSDLPSNTKTVKICIKDWVAIAKDTANTSAETTNTENIGFGIHFSVVVDRMADYSGEYYKCLIPFNVFDSEAIYFGDASEYQKASSAYGLVKEKKYWYNYGARVNPLYFYLFDHKEFQFISLEELFGGEVKTEFVVDLTEDEKDEDDKNEDEDAEERHSRKSEDEDEDDNNKVDEDEDDKNRMNNILF